MRVPVTAFLEEESHKFVFQDASIERLRETLATLFNVEPSFRLAYEDEECDRITISSSDELMEAITENTHLTLFLTNATKLPPKPSPAGPEFPELPPPTFSRSTNVMVQTEPKQEDTKETATSPPLPPPSQAALQSFVVQAAIVRCALRLEQNPPPATEDTLGALIQEATSFLQQLLPSLTQTPSPVDLARAVSDSLAAAALAAPLNLETELSTAFSSLLRAPQETEFTVFVSERPRTDDDFVLVNQDGEPSKPPSPQSPPSEEQEEEEEEEKEVEAALEPAPVVEAESEAELRQSPPDEEEEEEENLTAPPEALPVQSPLPAASYAPASYAPASLSPAPLATASPAPVPAPTQAPYTPASYATVPPVSAPRVPAPRAPAPAPAPASTTPAFYSPASIAATEPALLSPERIPYVPAPVTRDAVMEFDPFASQGDGRDPSEIEMFDTSNIEINFPPAGPSTAQAAPASTTTPAVYTPASHHPKPSPQAPAHAHALAPFPAPVAHAPQPTPASPYTPHSHTSTPFSSVPDFYHPQPASFPTSSTPNYTPASFPTANQSYYPAPTSYSPASYHPFSLVQPSHPAAAPTASLAYPQQPAAPQAPQIPTRAGGKWASQLSQLHDMGFKDDEQNIASLESFNGNLQTTIAFLLSDSY